MSQKTGVDALAVAIGTSHGAYKFTRKPTGEVLAMDRIVEIHDGCRIATWSCTASSSVPQDLQDDHQQVRRQDEADLGRAGRRNSARHQARRAENQRRYRQPHGDHRPRSAKCSAETPEKFDPRDYLKPAREAMKKVCVARMTAFGQAGQASKMRSARLV